VKWRYNEKCRTSSVVRHHTPPCSCAARHARPARQPLWLQTAAPPTYQSQPFAPLRLHVRGACRAARRPAGSGASSAPRLLTPPSATAQPAPAGDSRWASATRSALESAKRIISTENLSAAEKVVRDAASKAAPHVESSLGTASSFWDRLPLGVKTAAPPLAGGVAVRGKRSAEASSCG